MNRVIKILLSVLDGDIVMMGSMPFESYSCRAIVRYCFPRDQGWQLLFIVVIFLVVQAVLLKGSKRDDELLVGEPVRQLFMSIALSKELPELVSETLGYNLREDGMTEGNLQH
jgi:hypothetical protein